MSGAGVRMNLGEVIVILATIGSVTGIAAMLIDKFGGRGDKKLEAERLMMQQRLAFQEQRLAELERHNEQLEQALVWHRRLAEAQTEPLPAVRAPTAR
jgi:hypothetical protein